MTHLKVAVRVRPLSQREIDRQSVSIVEVENGNTIAITNLKVPEHYAGDSRERTRRFTFDYCFHENSRQDDIYNSIGSVIGESIKRRHHSCVLAYGQSSSGKTHTMMGFPHDPGLTPRLCQHIFQYLQEAAVGDEILDMKISVSYLEIYNEKVRDLLSENNTSESKYKSSILRVREHPKKGPYVQGLTEHFVQTADGLLYWLRVGNGNRSVAATQSNPLSSRSHAVFIVSCDGVKLHLVDLAGSERAVHRCYSVSRFREGANINKSLVALGNVICALAEQTSKSSRNIRRRFVPYRDSVLTWLLKDALGGNSQTVMIANISPSSTCYSETVNTLRFGQRAKLIVSRPVVNEDPKEKIIRELRAEIIRLKELLASKKIDPPMDITDSTPIMNNPSASVSEDNSLKDTEPNSYTDGTSTLNNIDEFSCTPSPIPELEENSDPNENSQSKNLILTKQESPQKNSEPDSKSHDQSKRNSVDSTCSTTEKIVPIMEVHSTVKGKAPQVPRLRRTTSEYAPFRMEKKNLPVFGSQETLSKANQAAAKKVANPLASRRKLSIDKPPPVLRTPVQKKIPPSTTKKSEKGVVTEVKSLAKVEPKVNSIRKMTPKPRSNIVAAVTQRLYEKSKKKEIGINTESPSEQGTPKELSICSNARLKLKELTRRAMRAHRFKDESTQTELFPVLRVKETSTDINDLKLCAEEVRDAETNISQPQMQNAGIDCTYLDSFSDKEPCDSRNAFVITRSCSTQVEEEFLVTKQEEEPENNQELPRVPPVPTVSFTKYLREKSQPKPELLESILPNSIYTNTVNINISHNYLNGQRTGGSLTTEDSLEEESPQNINLPTPDLISNHNSLEPHNLVDHEINNAAKQQSIEARMKYPSSFIEHHDFYIADEFLTMSPDYLVANCISIPDYSKKITSIDIPSVYVSEICVVPNKDDRCLPFPKFSPESAKPKVTEYEDYKCDDCIVLKEPLLLKSIMKLMPLNCPEDSQKMQNEDSSDDSIQSMEIPDSLEYHLANAKKVRFNKTKKLKKDRMTSVMSSFFEEATTLMNNLTAATNKLQQFQPLSDGFDIEVSISDVSSLRTEVDDQHRKKRKKQPHKCCKASESTQTEEKAVEDDCCQTLPVILLDNSTQYDCDIPVNKYEALLEDSCRRLEEKINYKKTPSEIYLSDPYLDDKFDQHDSNIEYNPWDLSGPIQNDFSSLESNPVTFSDYGSLPRKYPKRHRTSSCSPSALLRQLTNMRKQVIESSREELFK